MYCTCEHVLERVLAAPVGEHDELAVVDGARARIDARHVDAALEADLGRARGVVELARDLERVDATVVHLRARKSDVHKRNIISEQPRVVSSM